MLPFPCELTSGRPAPYLNLQDVPFVCWPPPQDETRPSVQEDHEARREPHHDTPPTGTDRQAADESGICPIGQSEFML